MKLLTVSLCLCAIVALTQASVIRRRSVCDGNESKEPSDEIPTTTFPPTTPPPTYPHTTTPFGFYPQCPDSNWRAFGIRCLRYVSDKKTWSAAMSNCDYGLVAALDDSFYDDVVTFLREVGHTSGQVWVGGCSTDVGGWDWSTYSFYDSNREPTCIKATPGENLSTCMNSSQCESQLPSVCSYTLM